jgi:hypothetical protein
VKQSNLIEKLIRLPRRYAPRNDWMEKIPNSTIYQRLEGRHQQIQIPKMTIWFIGRLELGIYLGFGI